MEDVKIPTCGHIVHYFPNDKDVICEHNGARKLPAVVVQDWGSLSVNLQVFTMNPDAPNVLRYSVCHENEATRDEVGNIVSAYWRWPEVN